MAFFVFVFLFYSHQQNIPRKSKIQNMNFDKFIQKIIQEQELNKTISYCFELSIYERQNQKIDNLEEIFFQYVSNGGPTVVFSNVQPKYVLESDTIFIPSINHFSNSLEYYYILFHEMSHSTMTKNRVDRIGLIDSHFEEVVSELSSCYITSKFCDWIFPQSSDFIRHHLNQSNFSKDDFLQLGTGRNIAISIAEFIINSQGG